MNPQFTHEPNGVDRWTDRNGMPRANNAAWRGVAHNVAEMLPNVIVGECIADNRATHPTKRVFTFRMSDGTISEVSAIRIGFDPSIHSWYEFRYTDISNGKLWLPVKKYRPEWREAV